jgi:hypothetical protein
VTQRNIEVAEFSILISTDERYRGIAFLIDWAFRQRGEQRIVRFEQDVEFLPKQLGVSIAQDMIHRAVDPLDIAIVVDRDDRIRLAG